MTEITLTPNEARNWRSLQARCAAVNEPDSDTVDRLLSTPEQIARYVHDTDPDNEEDA